MSAEARPISSDRFAQALEDLPVENLYAKAHEIQNSIHHLQRSNAQLQEYSDSIKNDTSLDENVRSEGDKDCLDAIRENQVVIDRQSERIGLLRAEVERRGGRWHEGGPQTGQVNGELPNGEQTGDARNTSTAAPGPARLTDEELRRRLEEQMAGDDEEGLHL